MDTQSADFFSLTPTLSYAYPRVEGSEGRQTHAWHTHRRAQNTRNDDWLLSIFLQPRPARGGGLAAVGETWGTPRAAKDARGARLSHPVRAATLLRRHSRHSRRLASPGRLAATSSSSGSSRRSTESSKIVPQTAAEITARSSSMVVVAPIDLEAHCINKSNAGLGQWAAPAHCVLAGGDMRLDKDQSGCGTTRGEAKQVERAGEAVAAAAPPVATHVLRCPLRPQPAMCKCRKRDHSAHAVDTQSVRVALSSSVRSMHLLEQHRRPRGHQVKRPTHRRSPRLEVFNGAA